MAADPRRHPKVLWSRIKVRWPFLIWILALLAFVSLWSDLGVKLVVPGVVTTKSHPVASIEAARVVKVHVVPGQEVKAGTVLVELDTSVLQGEIDAAEAEQAQRVAELQLDQSRVERQLQQIVFQAEADLADLAIQRAGEQAELSAIQVELTRLEPLVEKKLLDPQSVSQLRARRDALAKGLEQYPAAESARQANIAWAKSNLEQSKAEAAKLPVPADAPAARALRARLPLFTLSAPADGVVTNVAVSAGEAVNTRDVVATLVENASNRISGFLHEDAVAKLKLGDEMWAFVDPSERESFKVKVSALGPSVIDLPTGQSLFPGRVIRGRPVLFEVQGAHTMIPGQRVTIRTSVPWWVTKARGFFHKSEGSQ